MGDVSKATGISESTLTTAGAIFGGPPGGATAAYRAYDENRGGGGGGLSFAGAGTQEQQLQQESINLLRQWQDQIAQLRPLLLEQSGTQEIPNPEFEDLNRVLQNQFRAIQPENVRAIQEGRAPNFGIESASSRQNLNRAQRIINQLRNVPSTVLGATPERQAQEARLSQLQEQTTGLFETQLGQLQRQLEEQQSPGAIAAREQQRTLEEQFRGVVGQQLERQQAALAGELPVSEALKRQEQQAFEQFKDAQGRAGNIILGDTPAEAAARGTGAQNALSRFKERFELAKERERTGIIQGEAGISQAGLGQVSQIGLQGLLPGQLPTPGISPLAAAQPGFTGAIPSLTSQFPGLFGGVSQALQPFQFGQNLQFQAASQQSANEAAIKAAKYQAFGSIAGGLTTGLMGLGGAG